MEETRFSQLFDTDLAFAQLLRADLAARGITDFEIYPETVRRYRLPHSHADFRIPKKQVMQSIHRLTRGVIDANYFYELAGGSDVNAAAGGASGAAPGHPPRRSPAGENSNGARRSAPKPKAKAKKKRGRR